jgi:hypothetical protein
VHAIRRRRLTADNSVHPCYNDRDCDFDELCRSSNLHCDNTGGFFQCFASSSSIIRSITCGCICVLFSFCDFLRDAGIGTGEGCDNNENGRVGVVTPVECSYVFRKRARSCHSTSDNDELNKGNDGGVVDKVGTPVECSCVFRKRARSCHAISETDELEEEDEDGVEDIDDCRWGGHLLLDCSDVRESARNCHWRSESPDDISNVKFLARKRQGAQKRNNIKNC